MTTAKGRRGSAPPPFTIDMPERQLSPAIYASPHSGQHYPPELLAASAVPEIVLRRSADSFMEELFAAAPAQGSPLLRAEYARVYLDPNREPWELDPAMFSEPLPEHVNAASLRVAGGLGTIPRVAADGRDIYRRRLSFSQAETRVRRIYHPYHQALAGLIDQARGAFGYCLLIDCHSMPWSNGLVDGEGGPRRADFVLGDRFGTTCAAELTDRVHQTLSDLGYRVLRNNPYAGGFTTYHYGRPAAGVHALQIEINRRLYMDEEQVAPSPDLAEMTAAMTRLIADVRRLPPTAFEPLEAAAE